MNVVELFASIGLKADTQKAEKFLGTTKSIKIALTAAVTSAVALSAGFAKISSDAQKAALELKKFEADTGSSASTLQKWQAVANQVSGSGQAVAESIKAIALNQEQIKIGQGNVSGYQLLGIDPRTDPFEVIEQIKAKTEGLSQSMKRQVLSQFGVSRDLMSTLELTNEEFDKMSARAFIIPPGTLQTIDKTRMSMEQLRQGIGYIKAQITAALSPAIKAISDAATEFIRLNEKGIVKAAREAFTWITRFAQAIGRAAIMMDKIIRGTVGWETALKGVLILMAVLNAAFLTSPLGIFIAGMVLLVAVLDDLYVYSTGSGKSMIGMLVEKFPELEGVFNSIVEVLKAVGASMDAIFNNDFSKLDEMTKKWGLLGDALNIVVQALNIINQGLSLKSAKTSMEGIQEKGFFREYADEWKNLFGLITGTDWTGNERQAAAALAVSPGAAGSSQTTVNNNQKIDITIPGSKSPEATANEVTRKIDAYVKDAATQRARPKEGR